MKQTPQLLSFYFMLLLDTFKSMRVIPWGKAGRYKAQPEPKPMFLAPIVIATLSRSNSSGQNTLSAQNHFCTRKSGSNKYLKAKPYPCWVTKWCLFNVLCVRFFFWFERHWGWSCDEGAEWSWYRAKVDTRFWDPEGLENWLSVVSATQHPSQLQWFW